MQPRVTVSAIISTVARIDRLSVDEIVSPSRHRPLARARFRIVLLARRLRPDLPLTRLAHAIGRKDHTTILNADQRAAALLEADPAEQAAVARILTALGVDELPPARPGKFAAYAEARRIAAQRRVAYDRARRAQQQKARS
jgi:hypothetical protein